MGCFFDDDDDSIIHLRHQDQERDEFFSVLFSVAWCSALRVACVDGCSMPNAPSIMPIVRKTVHIEQT